MKKAFFVSLAAVSLTASLFATASADTATGTLVAPPFALDAIVTEKDALVGYVRNRPDETMDLKAFDGTEALTGTLLKYTGSGLVRVDFYPRIFGEISFEKSSIPVDVSASNPKKIERVGPIKVLRLENTKLLPNVRRESMYDVFAYVIPVSFENGIPDLKQKNVARKYSVTVNGGAEMVLELDENRKILPGKAYLTKDGIVIHESTFDKKTNVVQLKIDRAFSNQAFVQKETGLLGEVVSLDTMEKAGGYVSIVKFFNVANIKNLDRYEVTINGTAVMSALKSGTGGTSVHTISTGFGDMDPITFQIALPLLGVDESVARIAIKDKFSLQYYEKEIDLSSRIVPLVTSVTQKDNGGAYDVKVVVDPIALFGGYDKLKIVINGTGYTADGEKVTQKDASGAVRKDINGIEYYDFINKLDFKKTNSGLEFLIAKELLKSEENTIKIINNNSGKSSKTAIFNLSDPSVKYKEDLELKLSESISFTPGTAEKKQYDFFAAPKKGVSLGEIRIGTLDPASYYKTTGKIVFSTPYLPLSDLKIGTEYGKISSDGKTTTMEFERKSKGASLTSQNITISLPEIFDSEGNPVSVEIADLKLWKLESENFKEIARAGNASGYFSSLYQLSGCFDGTADVCGKNGFGADPSGIFAVEMGAGSSVIVPKSVTPVEPPKTVVTPAPTPVTPVAPTETPVRKKNNPYALVLPENSGTLAKLIHKKFTDSITKFGKKIAKDPKAKEKLLKLKKSMDKSIATAKKYEKEANKKLKAALKKGLIKDIKDVLKNLSTPSK